MQEITILGINGPTIISIPSGAIPEGHTLTITPVKRKEITLEELYEVAVRNDLCILDHHDNIMVNWTTASIDAFLIDLNKLGYKIVKE